MLPFGMMPAAAQESKSSARAATPVLPGKVHRTSSVPPGDYLDLAKLERLRTATTRAIRRRTVRRRRMERRATLRETIATGCRTWIGSSLSTTWMMYYSGAGAGLSGRRSPAFDLEE